MSGALDVRIASNAVRVAKLALGNAVNLGDGNALVLEGGSGRLVLGSEGLAVTTPGVSVSNYWLQFRAERVPRSEEFNKDEVLLVHDGVEVVGGQVNDIRGCDQALWRVRFSGWFELQCPRRLTAQKSAAPPMRVETRILKKE